MSAHLLVDRSTAIGLLARQHPATISVFERFDIDYACFGGRTIADAAYAAGADAEELLGELRAAVGRGEASEASLPDLVHQIITEHHNLERDVLRRLVKDLAPHGGDPDVARIRRLLTSFSNAAAPHMRREERELFPLVEELAIHPDRIRAGMISRRLFAEFVEHGTIHDRLTKIRELALRLRARRFGDNAILDQIEEFDRLAHRHIHMENNVLVPRVVEIENQLRAERNMVPA